MQAAPPDRQAGLDALPPDAVREHLAHLLQWRGFVQARQLSGLLAYTVEETLEGRAAHIKETTIGVDVFGRPPSFDPRVDPIVRVQATKLRARLKEYYETEGAHEPLRVIFPKGGYVPLIEPRRTENPPVAAEAPAAAATPSRPVRSAAFWLGALALAVVAGVTTAWLLNRPASPPVAHAIAVLPFVSSGAEEAEYFADGLTEQLIASLGRIPGLRVVARTSVFEYKGKQQDVRSISARLAVDRILEGSVLWEGKQVRVTARLVDGQTGYQLWTSSYNREVSGLFAVQDAVTGDIIATMQKRLGPQKHLAPTVSAAGQRTPDPEAHRLYLQGRYFWHTRRVDGLMKARRCFESAIAHDPAYAAAQAGLADTFCQMAAYELAPLEETREPALASARRAAELDPDSAEVQSALGYALGVFTLDRKHSEAAFRRAISLNPAHANAHRWLASLCLLFDGRTGEALQEALLAVKLDPISAYAQCDVGRMYSARGDYRAAVAEFRKAIELGPGHPRAHTELGFALERTGDLAGAQRSFEQAVQSSGRHPTYVADMARFYAATGRPAEARRLLPELEGKAGPYHLAALYAALGESDRAFAELDRAINSRLLPRVLLNRYDGLRGDPRFGRFLKQLEL